MSFNQSYIRFEFTVGYVDQAEEVALCQEMRQLSETVCPSLRPNNTNIEWENTNWSTQKTRFTLTYEEEYKYDVDKFLFKLKLKYPELKEYDPVELTCKY